MSSPSSSSQLRSVAVILAGGTGQRVGLKIPKQLLKIAGKPIIEHTIQTFEAAAEIDEIIVLMTPDFVGEVERIVAKGGYRKVSRVLPGGASRTETTRLAIAALTESARAAAGTETGTETDAAAADCNVLFHDAVRPFVEHRIIAECVEALSGYEAVDVAIPSSDTIVTVDEYSGTVIKDVPRRDLLRRGQTPQCFRLSTIRRAYELAFGDPEFTAGNVTATDDCSVVLRYLPDVPIYVVTGSEHNMKVTHPVDVFIADKLFQLGSSAPPPPGEPAAYRERLAGKTMVIFGGSYGIGGDIADLATKFGAKVYSFSRTATGTHVENPADVHGALATAHEETGRIDYVVNTAGVLHMGKLADTDDEVIDESFRVNYLAPVTIARSAIPFLRDTGGHLLLYTSSSYTRGRADYSLYSSTKAAVVNLTQALADEWAELGVRVNCVNPERTATPMRTRAFGDEPAGTLLSSQVVALASIDVLISDLTGHVIDVRRQDPLGGETTRTLGEIDYIVGAVAEAEERAEADAEQQAEAGAPEGPGGTTG